MSLETYISNTAEIITNVGLSPQLFYNLEDSPNQLEFLGIFNFYKETLEINKDYGVDPAHIFFVNSFSIID